MNKTHATSKRMTYILMYWIHVRFFVLCFVFSRHGCMYLSWNQIKCDYPHHVTIKHRAILQCAKCADGIATLTQWRNTHDFPVGITLALLSRRQGLCNSIEVLLPLLNCHRTSRVCMLYDSMTSLCWLSLVNFYMVKAFAFDRAKQPRNPAGKVDFSTIRTSIFQRPIKIVEILTSLKIYLNSHWKIHVENLLEKSLT